MEGKSGFLAIISILGLVVALVIVATMNKPVINVPSTAPVTVESPNCIKTANYNSDITATGDAVVTVNPDEAVAFFAIVTEGNDTKKIKDENRDTTGKVISALKNFGIKDDKIETQEYSLEKKPQEWSSDLNKNVDVGYTLRHVLKVTITQAESKTSKITVDSIGELVDVAVDSGANGVNSIYFDLTKETQRRIREELIANATINAKKKAESLSNNLGIKLGKLVGVTESYYYPYSSYSGGSYYYDSYKVASTTISPQNIEISTSVTVVYEIA